MRGRTIAIILVLLALVPLLVPLLISYYNAGIPSKDASYSISPPYILSVKPNKIDDKSNTTISLNTINGSVPKLPIGLSVITPEGKNLITGQTALGDHSFPGDFNTTAPLPHGVYNILLLDQNNSKILSSVKFNITQVAPEMIYFNPTVYLPILVSVLIPALVIVFKFITDERSKNEGRIEKKLTWMHENMKTYIDISSASWNICESINDLFHKDRSAYYFTEDRDTVHFDRTKILPRKDHDKKVEHLLNDIVAYNKAFKDYVSSTNLIYLDDFLTEEVITRLHNRIQHELAEIFGELQIDDLSSTKSYTSDATTSDDKKYAELFKKFKSKLYHFFLTSPNQYPWCTVIDDKGKPIACCNNPIESFYKNHLTNFYLLNMSVNKIASLTYSTSDKGMNDLHALNRNHERQLSKHANNLVEIFLGHIYNNEIWYPFQRLYNFIKRKYNPFKW